MITDYKLVPGNKFINYQDTIYSMMEYTAKMKIKITEPESQHVDALLLEFRKQFGTNNIQFDPSTNTLFIKAINSIYAISVDRGENWYFIENWMGREDQAFYKMIIPEVVLAKLENGE